MGYQSDLNSIGVQIGLLGDGLVRNLNLCDYSKITMNAYLGASGAVVSASNYAYSDFIPVRVGITYCWWGAFSVSYQATAYDSNKNFVKTIFTTDLQGAAHNYNYTVPSGQNIAFIRFNMSTTQDNTMVIEGTSYPSSYTAYGQILLSSNLKEGINNSLGLYQIQIDKTNFNTALGPNNLTGINKSSYNTAMGYAALQVAYDDGTTLDSGRYNTAIGYGALKNNTIGNHNTAVGYGASQGITTGTGNTSIGEDSLLQETTGTGNTALGHRSMQISNGATNNTAVGISAMYFDATSNVTGSENTAVGHYAGSRTSGDTDCTFVGHFANKDNKANSYSNSTAIGANAIVSKSNQIMLGSSSVTEIDTYGDIACLTNGKGLILQSPNGTKYKLTVSDVGALTVTAV